MMEQLDTRDTGRLAMAVGAVAGASAACLLAFYVAKGPLGTLNDVGNATTGILSAALAWRLRRMVPGRAGDVVVGTSLAGAALTVVGSTLVISGTTGFFFAGLVSGLGFAGIGAWLVALNRSASSASWPRRLRSLGVLTGTLMAFGVALVPGILLRLDDMETAPAWVWIGFLGWFGTFLVYPAWAIWMGTIESRRTGRTAPLPASAVAEQLGR
ncbi:MAG TPA: hypothetical protein VFW02_00750 [Candidatus Limnocylindrales bacterium]|nr:hypothetical protein [Candidatus Limnocylindrales bacterium]